MAGCLDMLALTLKYVVTELTITAMPVTMIPLRFFGEALHASRNLSEIEAPKMLAFWALSTSCGEMPWLPLPCLAVAMPLRTRNSEMKTGNCTTSGRQPD